MNSWLCSLISPLNFRLAKSMSTRARGFSSVTPLRSLPPLSVKCAGSIDPHLFRLALPHISLSYYYSTLTPGSGQYCTPLFQNHAPYQPQRKGIPLGEHVCIHQNPGRLPPPFLDRSERLTLLRVDSGGPGAMQYWHSFCPDGPQLSLHTVTPATHPLPSAFSSVLLCCEGWAEEDDLFPNPHALLLMTPTSASGAQMTPPSPHLTTPSLSVT